MIQFWNGQKLVQVAHAANESNYVDTIQGVATIKIANNRTVLFLNLQKTV